MKKKTVRGSRACLIFFARRNKIKKNDKIVNSSSCFQNKQKFQLARMFASISYLYAHKAFRTLSMELLFSFKIEIQ